jgi:putative addiction module component (TIGR02574 family)
MNRRTMLDAVLTLPPRERTSLVKEIWDSLAEHPDALKLTKAQERELARCWREYLANPKAGASWAATKASIIRRRS